MPNIKDAWAVHTVQLHVLVIHYFLSHLNTLLNQYGGREIALPSTQSESCAAVVRRHVSGERLPLLHLSDICLSWYLYVDWEGVEILTLPGSSLERGTLRKHLFKDRLCRMEFCRLAEREGERRTVRSMASTLRHPPLPDISNASEWAFAKVKFCKVWFLNSWSRSFGKRKIIWVELSPGLLCKPARLKEKLSPWWCSQPTSRQLPLLCGKSTKVVGKQASIYLLYTIQPKSWVKQSLPKEHVQRK